MVDVLGGAWGVITASLTFLFGLLLTVVFSRRFSVPSKRAVLIYLWHTLFCVLYVIYARSNTADANGYFYRSLEPGSMAVGTQFVTALASFFTRFLGFSYLGIFLVFNWIGSMGVVTLYGSLRHVTRRSSRHLRLMAFAVVFLPSVSFWSAALGKDAIAFTSATLFLWSALSFKSRLRLCAFAVVLMLCVRPHMAGIMVIAVAVSLAVSREVKPLARLSLAVVTIAAASAAIPFALRYAGIEETASFQEVAGYVESRQSANLGGGSSIDISSMSLPEQVFTYLFRPLPHEARGFSSLLSATENMLLLLLLGSAVFVVARRWTSVWRAWPKEGSSSMLVVYSFAGSALLAMVTSNLGIAVRQKWMVMPILIYLVFFCLASRRAWTR